MFQFFELYFDNLINFILANFNRKDITLTVFYQKKSGIPGEILESFQGDLKYIVIDHESGLFEELQTHRYDAMIAGAHGRHKLAEFVVGSAAIHLVRKSTIPLFIVN